MTGAGSRPLFHGGHPGLEPGDLLLPAAEAGASVPLPADLPAKLSPVTRVYLTPDLPLAAMFAARGHAGTAHYGGAVYEVEPLGDLQPDPYGRTDHAACQVLACSLAGAETPAPAGSWMTTSARASSGSFARDVRFSGAALDAYLDAADLVAAQAELQAQDPERFAAVVGAPAVPSLRASLARALGWPEEVDLSGLGDPDGWEPCRPRHRHWGTCGGAELRWVPGSLSSPMQGRRCRTTPARQLVKA